MLSKTQMNAFERDGYLVLTDLLDATLLRGVRADYDQKLASLCRDWVADGHLGAEVLDGDFDARLRAANAAGIDWFQPLDISLPTGPFSRDTPMFASAGAFALMRAPRVLDAVEALLGPELTSTPIQHVRIKPPLRDVHHGEDRAHIVGTAWHQDRAVALDEADTTGLVTVWLAISDATRANGCLQVIPGSHKGRMQTHCPASQLSIPTSEFDHEQACPLPVPAGGAILFHPLTVHSSRDNESNELRWSFDIRYHITGQPSGRPQFPGFIARSRRDPASELADAQQWARSWDDARETLAEQSDQLQFHRWNHKAAICA